MEIHYDNYDNVEFTDSSGLRMSYTPTLRPHDIGVLYTGSLPGIAVPPGIEAFDLNARCPSMCQETLPSDGVTVFASVLHMHTAGRAMSADLLAQDGTFKASLGAEPFYDFNFQTTNNLDVTMMPNDQLHTKCTFGTLDRSETTIFGLRTQDEMCLAYLWYVRLVRSSPVKFACESRASYAVFVRFARNERRSCRSLTARSPPRFQRVRFAARSERLFCSRSPRAPSQVLSSGGEGGSVYLWKCQHGGARRG